jgi:hypothetical protein
VIVGSALVAWSLTYTSVLESRGKEDYPISVTGAALEHVFRTLPMPSQVTLLPETEEIHHALHGWVLRRVENTQAGDY